MFSQTFLHFKIQVGIYIYIERVREREGERVPDQYFLVPDLLVMPPRMDKYIIWGTLELMRSSSLDYGLKPIQTSSH